VVTITLNNKTVAVARIENIVAKLLFDHFLKKILWPNYYSIALFDRFLKNYCGQIIIS
jgi:hypothetical protein